MTDTSWITRGIAALAGLYLIYVELGLSEKTPLLYLGIALILPLAIKAIMSFSSK